MPISRRVLKLCMSANVPAHRAVAMVVAGRRRVRLGYGIILCVWILLGFIVGALWRRRSPTTSSRTREI